MRSVEARVADWIDVFADVIGTPRPAEATMTFLGEHLLDAFDSDLVTVSLRSKNGDIVVDGLTRGARLFGGRPLADAITEFNPVMEKRLVDHHPIVAWHAATRSMQPQIYQLTPAMFRRTPLAMEITDVLGFLEMDHQLVLPSMSSGREHKAFVLQRPAAGEYSTEDLAVARRIQPLFVAMQRQMTVLSHVPLDAVGAAFLTGRELAVLACIARGMKAGAIGRELMVSQRTVEKHTENAYRKLGVGDRVSAVRAAQQARILA